jgi:hypothetical protein
MKNVLITGLEVSDRNLFRHKQVFVCKHEVFTFNAGKRKHLERRKFDEPVSRTRLNGKEQLQPSSNTSEAELEHRPR